MSSKAEITSPSHANSSKWPAEVYTVYLHTQTQTHSCAGVYTHTHARARAHTHTRIHSLLCPAAVQACLHVADEGIVDAL